MGHQWSSQEAGLLLRVQVHVRVLKGSKTDAKNVNLCRDSQGRSSFQSGHRKSRCKNPLLFGHGLFMHNFKGKAFSMAPRKLLFVDFDRKSTVIRPPRVDLDGVQQVSRSPTLTVLLVLPKNQGY